MATPVRARRSRLPLVVDPVTPAKLVLPLKTDRRDSVKSQHTPGTYISAFLLMFLSAKTVAASLAALQTPIQAEQSPASVSTPQNKKIKSPQKEKPQSRSRTPETSTEAVPVSKQAESICLPAHYKRLVDDLRILDEVLAHFRTKNQVPYFSTVSANIRGVSGRRFTIDNFRQLMAATVGELFKVDWQEVRDVEGKLLQLDLAVRAIDHEKGGTEIFSRLLPEQSASRKVKIEAFLRERLGEYLEKVAGGDPENAYPIKPMDLPEKPPGERESSTAGSTPVGRWRILSRCDSVGSNGGSEVKTPKSSLRRQLSVSASPIIPNSLPQFLSTPVKLRPIPTSPPMSTKEKLDAIRNRVKAKEAVDVEEAEKYDLEMHRKEKLDEFDLCVKLLIKLNRKFPRGIRTAKLSTLQREFASLFVNPADVDKWTRKICAFVPHHFEMDRIGTEEVLRFKGVDTKFSAIKKELEELKLAFEKSLLTINVRE